MNVPLFGKCLCRYNQFRMRSYWTKVGPKPMTGVFTGERDLETHRKKGHMRMEAATSPGKPTIARSLQES